MKYIYLLLLTMVLITPSLADISPDAIGQPARYQALGLSCAAFQNDINNLFFNPAGIDNIYNVQAISMYTKLLSSVYYKVLGVSVPIWGSTIGFGLNTISLDGVPHATSFDPQTGNPNLRSDDYSNNLYQLTLSRSLESSFDLPITLGASYKKYKQGINSFADLSAAGYGVDLGVIYKFPPSAAVSLTAKNAISSLTWGGGTKEHLDKNLLLGGACDMFNSSLTLAGTLDFNLNSHTGYLMGGLEYTYEDLYSLRFGYRERPYVSAQNKPDKSGNFSMGAGMRIGDVLVDYAYVPYGSLAEDGAHYISIAFMPIQSKSEYFSVELPTSNQIIYDPYVLVEGVANHNIYKIRINNRPIHVSDEVFVVPVTLNLGENNLVVDANGVRGGLYHKETKFLHFKQFNDVPLDYNGKINFDVMYTYDIVQGDEQGNFNPKEKIERSGFIAAVLKLKGQVTKVYFDKKRKQDYLFKLVSDMLDFDTRDWAAEYIAQAKKENIVIGYPDLTLRQKNFITRAEAMTIIARVEKLMNKKDDRRSSNVATSNQQVNWMPQDYWAYPYVSALKKARYLDYVDNNKRFIIDYILDPEEKARFLEFFVASYNMICASSQSVTVSSAVIPAEVTLNSGDAAVTANDVIGTSEFLKEIQPTKNEVVQAVFSNPLASSGNVNQLLDTPIGSQLYYDYLRKIDFIKGPINKFELIEMLGKTTFFQTFLKNIGISNSHL